MTKTTGTVERDEATIQTVWVDEPVSEIEETVVALLNVAVVTGSDGVVKCEMCGEHDYNHLDTCPVPALEDWINPPMLIGDVTEG